MWLALAVSILAQVNASVPPSQPTLPSPQERAMEAMRTAGMEGAGDAHYLRRADGRQGDVAEPREIDAALTAYDAALRKNKSDADSRWKYLRATYFKAEYTGLGPDQKAALYERAMPVAEEAVALERRRAADKVGSNPAGLEPSQIGTALAGDVTAGETFFWNAVNWGQWSLVHGKMAAVRQGVAGKIRDSARATIAIDPKLEDAGGQRVLGRLHAVAPKVIFFTGWVDRDESVRLLRQAVEIAPGNLVNRFYLAEALHEFTEDKAAAVDLLKSVLAATPHPDHLIEDLRVQADAKKDLESWGAS
jgi:tetratricopeptide (TPR) repeat protein